MDELLARLGIPHLVAKQSNRRTKGKCSTAAMVARFCRMRL
jgi:hypothetical protein